MSALQSFLAYLADAHGCPAVQRGSDKGCENGLRFVETSERELERDGCDVTRLAMEAKVAVFAVEFDTEPCFDRLERRLTKLGLQAAFTGHHPERPSCLLAIIDRVASAVAQEAAPLNFRVLAVMPAYNEGDIIGQTLRDLCDQDIHVHLVDNWSTDDTRDIAATFRGRGVSLETFPAGTPSRTYDLSQLLGQVEDIAASSSSYDWIVLHDADERRRSPWPGVGLRDALWRVQQSGYNCIDHVTLNFWPVDNSFDSTGEDIERQLVFYEPSSHAGHFHQRRAWRNRHGRVSLSPTAGHDCAFVGRRVYPYKFLLKHYPIRSQSHGARKVMGERRQRWNSEERARGWHAQYDDAGTSFLRDPRKMQRFDDSTFFQTQLVQRLSGAGYFQVPPDWATAPKW